MTAKQLSEISEATLKRLPLYYREIQEIKSNGTEHVSATDISNKTGFLPITVRKDLQKAGAIGKPKVGYGINEISELLIDVLGLNNNNQAVLIGAGNLGYAILGYKGFVNCGLNIVSAFDTDDSKINKEYYGKKILSLDHFEEIVKRDNIKIGIISTPPEFAQEIADKMVRAGITGIWNFSSIKLTVPDNIIVENVDLSISLSVLMTKMNGSDE